MAERVVERECVDKIEEDKVGALRESIKISSLIEEGEGEFGKDAVKQPFLFDSVNLEQRVKKKYKAKVGVKDSKRDLLVAIEVIGRKRKVATPKDEKLLAKKEKLKLKRFAIF